MKIDDLLITPKGVGCIRDNFKISNGKVCLVTCLGKDPFEEKILFNVLFVVRRLLKKLQGAS